MTEHKMPSTVASVSGASLLRHSFFNKSTAVTREERDRLGLRGLLPHCVSSMEQRCARVLENLRRKEFAHIFRATRGFYITPNAYVLPGIGLGAIVESADAIEERVRAFVFEPVYAD